MLPTLLIAELSEVISFSVPSRVENLILYSELIVFGTVDKNTVLGITTNLPFSFATCVGQPFQRNSIGKCLNNNNNKKDNIYFAKLGNLRHG